ncbi:MAG: HDOD domain-containing protein [Pseudomonadales bacterium]
MSDAAEQVALVPMGKLVTASSKLYSLPDVYLKIKSIIADPNSQISELGNVLSTDPSLCARLLRISNSAFFGLSNSVDTISRAVQVIGFKHIHNLVVATSITRAFDGLSSDTVNIQQFWMSSVERALLARILASRQRFPDAERLFVGGLLLDIGHLVMYEHMPEMMEDAILRAEVESRPLHVLETELLGFNASELGAALAKHWQLPESLSNLILYQDQPELSENQLEAAIIYVAKQLAGTVPETESVQMVFDSLPANVKETLSLTPQTCEQLLFEVLGELSETLELIIPQG